MTILASIIGGLVLIGLVGLGIAKAIEHLNGKKGSRKQ